MSNNNPLPAQTDVERCPREYSRVGGGAKLWTSLAAASLLFIVSGMASAAELDDVKTHHARMHRQIRATDYYGCRTGWWQTYYAGTLGAHWATRCKVV